MIIWAAGFLYSSLLKEMSLKSMSDGYFPKNKEENVHLSSSIMILEKIETFINFFRGAHYANVWVGCFKKILL